MAKRRRSTDDIFQIYRSLKARYPIAQFGTATRCVTDVQQFESIESAYNRVHGTNHDFQQFIIINRVVRNRSEQGLTKTLNRRGDLVALAGIHAADLKHMASQPMDDDDEEDWIE